MNTVEQPVQAAVPADLDTPDRILYGLSARQVAILAGTGALLWVAVHALSALLPPVAVVVAALPVAAAAVAVALGRRDGISMDRWLLAAVRSARRPRRLVAAGHEVADAPGWASAAAGHGAAAAPAPAPLRLPAQAITGGGVVDVEGGRVALTAATTVNFDLRSVEEQHALVEGYSRWLNCLTSPVQVVISTRRVDMHAYAEHVEDRIDGLPHPALADAAAGYAAFLRWLADERDPLARHVLVAHQVGAASDAGVARRHAEQSARALSALGSATRVLDGGQVTDALVGACDPWRHVGTGRATPEAVITAVHDAQDAR
jgi:hypothetical protein